jgi:hypothetical protein
MVYIGPLMIHGFRHTLGFVGCVPVDMRCCILNIVLDDRSVTEPATGLPHTRAHTLTD